jgi:Fic family protein
MHIFDYETSPKVLLTPEIIALVSAIHEYKGRQSLYLNARADVLNALMEVAKIQSTTSSNRIEGISTTDARMRELMMQKTVPRNRNEQEIAGYRDVLATIHENHDFISVTPDVLLQLHRDLYSKQPQGTGGHWKLSDNVIEEIDASGKTFVRFRPASAVETPMAMDKLCENYRRAIDAGTFDSLLLIPMFVFDFLCIHPFHDGNGRMSRLLTLLLLYKNGYSVGKYISIEKQIEKTKDRYYDTLEMADAGWHESQNDPTPFIRYMLTVILACYTEFEDRVGLLDKSGITSTAYDIVKKYVEGKVGKFTGAEVLANCPSIGRSSALAALKKLTEEGVILRQGAGKGTFYVRADGAEDL